MGYVRTELDDVRVAISELRKARTKMGKESPGSAHVAKALRTLLVVEDTIEEIKREELKRSLRRLADGQVKFAEPPKVVTAQVEPALV